LKGSRVITESKSTCAPRNGGQAKLEVRNTNQIV
jgi:hypothetical protein